MILPIWFDYANPVSGRVPCAVRPDLWLDANGYQQPLDAREANRSP